MQVLAFPFQILCECWVIALGYLKHAYILKFKICVLSNNYFFQHHNLTKLRLLINEKYDVNLEDYHQLHGWSVQNYGSFWSEVWKFSGVISSIESDLPVDTAVPMNEIPEWFPGARLNYAENLLRYICSSAL